MYQITMDTQSITARELSHAMEQLLTLRETVNEENVLTEAYLGSLLDLAGKLYFGQVDIANRLLAEQMDIKYSRTLSVGMMGYLPDGTLFTDIDLDSRIIPEYYENTKEFNLLSGIRSSAYESIVWEQLIGVHSASTISLFREATDCGIPIHLLNSENFDTVSQKLTLSESTMQTVKGHVENGKMVILPETELTMGDWSGTGYMVRDPDTYTGQYMVDGGLTGELNGGVTSEAVDRAMFINFYMTLEDCVGAITLCCQLLRYIPAGGVVGALMMVAIVALGAYLIYTSIAYYQESEDLAERYYAGDMAAGEELINRTAWDVTISIFAWAFGIGTYVNTALTRRAGASLTKTVGREAADKLMEGAKVPADLTKHVEKFLELGMTTEAITNLAETLKPVNFEKLGRLARQGMPIELLESLAKNERVLEEFDEVMLLLFKDSKLDPDTIIRHLAEEGEDFVSRFVKHGDEVFESGSGLVKEGLGKISGKQYAVSKTDIENIKKYLTEQGFIEDYENQAMLSRLEDALAKGEKITGADAVYYFHELKEAELVASGIEQSVAHDMALQYYEVSPYSVYHPDVIIMQPEWWNSAWFEFWGIER